MRAFQFLTTILLTFILAACNSGPKVIESEPSAETGSSAVNQVLQGQGGMTATNTSSSNEEHKVVAEETLHTDKYTYVRVAENGQSFWIAIPKSNVNIGSTYYYRGGLMKKNFQSREFNRTFETLYLISGLSSEPSTEAASMVDQALGHNHPSGGSSEVAAPESSEIKAAKGAIKIADLMGNLSKYDGKVVKVTGKCVKLNRMIMGRNWVHLQDGSANNFDLTITTMEPVELGSVVTLEGTIALNKDFGAGYKYNVILEGAVLKN